MAKSKSKKVTEDEPSLPLIEIISVLDRSGSMESIQTEAIGAYNTFLKEQRDMPGAIKLTTVLFDDHYDILYHCEPLDTVPDMDEKTFVPRGMTALYDAIGKTIQTVSERIRITKEEFRPAKLIMVILTDGQENASKEYNGAKISKLIDAKLKEGWEFIYLASDIYQFQDVAFSSVSFSMNFEASKSTHAPRSIGNKGVDGVENFMNSRIRESRKRAYEKYEEEEKKKQ